MFFFLAMLILSSRLCCKSTSLAISQLKYYHGNVNEADVPKYSMVDLRKREVQKYLPLQKQWLCKCWTQEVRWLTDYTLVRMQIVNMAHAKAKTGLLLEDSFSHVNYERTKSTLRKPLKNEHQPVSDTEQRNR